MTADRRIASLFLPSLLILSLTAAAENHLAAYAQAMAEEEPLQRAVYLLLRLAGVVWITVEWIAALVLIRFFYWLRPRWTRHQSETAR